MPGGRAHGPSVIRTDFVDKNSDRWVASSGPTAESLPAPVLCDEDVPVDHWNRLVALRRQEVDSSMAGFALRLCGGHLK